MTRVTVGVGMSAVPDQVTWKPLTPVPNVVPLEPTTVAVALLGSAASRAVLSPAAV